MATGDKKCSTCGTLKPVAEYSKGSLRCNKCRATERKNRANRSLKGFLQNRLTNLLIRHKKYGGEPIDLGDLERLYVEQNGICAISGIPMHTTLNESDLAVSPDRLDNSIGYVKGNVRLVCARANMMMSTMDDAHFTWWCRAVVNNSGN